MIAPNHIRCLDHIAILVSDTDKALSHYRDRLGLTVVSSEAIDSPQARLTYLDAGNVYIQLIEPLDPTSEFARSCAEHGEGLHHLCFGVDDPVAAASAMSLDGTGSEVAAGTGRGRVSAFVPGPLANGVLVECTEFREDDQFGPFRTPELEA
jgi:methylmalonyl-CoA/ethylmalonyl-CoA epimerase